MPDKIDKNLRKLAAGGWEARFKLHGLEHRRKFRTRDLAESWLSSSRLRREDLGKGNGVSGGKWGRIMTALELLAPNEALDEGIKKLLPAIRFYLLHCPPDVQIPLVPEAVEDLIATWRAEKKNKRYIANAGCILRRFAGSFEDRLLSTLSASEVQQWVLLQSPGARTSSKARVSALFSHAVLRGWVKANLCKQFFAPRQTTKPVEVPSPAQIENFLKVACSSSETKLLAAYFCIRLFAGLRGSEAAILLWGHIDFEAAIISVPKVIAAKHGPARRVPLQPNLAAWLLWLKPSSTAPSIAPSGVARLDRIFRSQHGFTGPIWNNALRQSYGSYRSPQLSDLDVLAEEMGNSRRVLCDHYVGAVSADSVVQFWGIKPKVITN